LPGLTALRGPVVWAIATNSSEPGSRRNCCEKLVPTLPFLRRNVNHLYGFEGSPRQRRGEGSQTSNVWLACANDWRNIGFDFGRGSGEQKVARHETPSVAVNGGERTFGSRPADDYALEARTEICARLQWPI